MDYAARFAFAVLMLAHMAAYFAVRRFYGNDGDVEDGRICPHPRRIGADGPQRPDTSSAVGGGLPGP
jgi:hypothetical protein